MTFPSTDIDWADVSGEAASLARTAERTWNAPALLYVESGRVVSTGYVFSRRGGNGASRLTEWSGMRSEVVGDSSRRARWVEGIGLDRAQALVGSVEPNRSQDRPFPSDHADREPGGDGHLVERLVDAASASGRFRLVEAEVRRLERRILLCRSGAEPVFRTETSLRWRLRLLAAEARDYEEWTGVGEPHHPERTAVEAAELALDRTSSRPPDPGPVTVLLGPEAAAVWLHEVLGHTLEADYAARGGTPPTTGGGLSVWTVPLFPGSCDDEGNPERRARLESGGPARTLICDERLAGDLGLPRTGNGRRQDFRWPILPRIGALMAEADPSAGLPTPDASMLAAASRSGVSLRVDSVLAGHVVPEDGTFMLDVGRADRFAGGRHAGPVGRFRLSGGVGEALGQVTAVGTEGPSANPAEWPRRLCVKDGQVVETANTCPSVVLQHLAVVPS